MFKSFVVAMFLINSSYAGDTKNELPCRVDQGATITLGYKSPETLNAEEKSRAASEMREPVVVTSSELTVSFTGVNLESTLRNVYPLVMMQNDAIVHRYTEGFYVTPKAPYQTGNELWFNYYSTPIPISPPFTAYVISKTHNFRCTFDVDENGIVTYPLGYNALNQARFQPK